MRYIIINCTDGVLILDRETNRIITANDNDFYNILNQIILNYYEQR